MGKPAVLIVVLSAVALLALAAWAHWPLEPLPAGTKVDRIVVEKAARRLTLYSGGAPVRSYRVSLGRAPVGPKQREGDKKTPEGRYRIIEHKADSSYHRALRVSYPELADVERAKRQGVSAGSDIMVHGLANGLGFFGRTHRVADWTAGCVALTDDEIEQVYAAVADGTEIEIRP